MQWDRSEVRNAIKMQLWQVSWSNVLTCDKLFLSLKTTLLNGVMLQSYICWCNRSYLTQIHKRQKLFHFMRNLLVIILSIPANKKSISKSLTRF